MTGTVGTASDTSPEALLKQAVMGARPAAKPAAKPAPTPAVAPAARMRRIDPRLAGLVGAALLVGAGLGAGASHLGATSEDRAALAQLQHRLGTAQAETDRIAAALAQLGKGVAQVQDSTDAARGEARTRGTALMERVARSEQALAAKLGALNERVDQGEKDHAGRLAALTAQVEKRAAAPAPVPVAAKAVSDKAGSDKAGSDKAVEPTETGALADKAPAAPKPPASDNWAVREVYDGIAVLEDRKRRLVEVAIGDTVPGVGRVETIERRGRAWAVVTRQGVITPQTW